MAWSVPTFAREPVDTPVVTTVDDAYLTPVGHGPLATLEPNVRWITGAVYDAESRLVPGSQKVAGLADHSWIPADPGRVGRRADVEVLTGTWLYGGHWMQHFGHFVVETITTLWPDVAVDGLVFHKYLKRPWAVEPWQARLLSWCVDGGPPVRVVDSRRPLAVERLLVPERSVVTRGWVQPQAVGVWDRVVAGAGRPRMSPARVYLSRTAHHQARREAGNPRARSSQDRDRRLDEVFAAAGFDVVTPEHLDIAEQIRLASGAEVLAGSSGSSLHLAAFAPTATRVVEVGDERSPLVGLPTQRLVDAARLHRHAFVPADSSPDDVRSRLDLLLDTDQDPDEDPDGDAGAGTGGGSSPSVGDDVGAGRRGRWSRLRGRTDRPADRAGS